MKNFQIGRARIFSGLFIVFCLLGPDGLFSQSGVWTWMHGSPQAGYPGNYGTKGVTAPSNEPPAKYQAEHWQDKDGIFWMFGGTGPGGSHNDTWKFDPGTNQWTWMHGPQASNLAGEFGVKGIPSSTNLPPANSYGAATWYDGKNGLYMYGGSAFGGGAATNLWKYDISTNEWVWLSGMGNIENLVDYGIKGVAATSNNPGFRAECESSWFRNDTLWLFGGLCKEVGNPNYSSCSDVWAYDISSNLWTWIKEPKGYSESGNPGILGEHDEANYPSGRMTFANWLGDSVLYTFSGRSYTGGTQKTDLWQFRFRDHTWAWIDGSQNMVNAIWQDYCDDNLLDNPGTKMEHHTVQAEFNCEDVFWLFGGLEATFSNDLWAYIPSKRKWVVVWGNPTVPQAEYFGAKGVPSISNVIPARSGACIWTDSSDNIWVFGGYRKSINWFLGGDMWRFEPDYSCFDLDSNTCCELTVDIRLGHVSSDSIDNGTISINVLDGEGENEYSIDGGMTWFDDNFFENLPAGDYDIVVRDSTGCTYEGVVTILDFMTSTFGLPNDLDIELFPNPASDMLYYAIGSRDVDRIEVYSMSGVQMQFRKADRRIEVKDFPSGNYFLRITSEGKSGVVRFEKI